MKSLEESSSPDYNSPMMQGHASTRRVWTTLTTDVEHVNSGNLEAKVLGEQAIDEPKTPPTTG